MKRIFKFSLYIIVFFISIILFLPKESFYNLLEKELEKKQILISNETRKENLFDFQVSNADIFYQGINIARFDNLDFSSYFFYTKIALSNTHFLDSLTSFAPSPIEKVVIEYSILNINKIKINSVGLFGSLKADIDIFAKSIKIELIASNEMKTSYSKLLKNMNYENERYIYEYKF